MPCTHTHTATVETCGMTGSLLSNTHTVTNYEAIFEIDHSFSPFVTLCCACVWLCVCANAARNTSTVKCKMSAVGLSSAALHGNVNLWFVSLSLCLRRSQFFLFLFFVVSLLHLQQRQTVIYSERNRIKIGHFLCVGCGRIEIMICWSCCVVVCHRFPIESYISCHLTRPKAWHSI